jgi:hypothetical protein
MHKTIPIRSPLLKKERNTEGNAKKMEAGKNIRPIPIERVIPRIVVLR